MIAIYHNPGSFSDRWEAYCEGNSVPFLAVNLFENGLIERLRFAGVKDLFFHISEHMAPRTRLAARSICQSLEIAGIRVFPNHASYWHCDDKVAQHYLLEALDLPRCNTYVFYSCEEALDWARKTDFPKVFKLRCGAGSSNVKLVRDRHAAEQLIATMFGRGLKAVPGLFGDLATRIHVHSAKRDWKATLQRLPSTIRKLRHTNATTSRERGYVYFQDFQPNNDFDTRITVIGQRAYAFRRFVRPGDFRASGSGLLDMNQDEVDRRCIKIAFETAGKIDCPCMAFDFVYPDSGNPLILEMCYAFDPSAIKMCPGYWDQDLRFYEGHEWPQDVILKNLIREDVGT